MLRNASDYSVCGMVLEMKALTVRQPWASLIVRGGKDIENRNWATRYTGLVAIHSSAKMARADMEDACALMRALTDRNTGMTVSGFLCFCRFWVLPFSWSCWLCICGGHHENRGE